METPFARSFAADDWFPFQLKRLRRYLREHNIGRVTIRSAVRRSTRTRCSANCACVANGNASFLTRVIGEPVVIIGREQSVHGSAVTTDNRQ